MRMMDELKPLFLYSSKKKVYVPIDEKDRRHNSAILLLSPDIETSNNLMQLPYLHNPNLFNALYIDRDVTQFISKSEFEHIKLDEQDEEALSEMMLVNWNRSASFKFDENASTMDKRIIERVLNPRTTTEIYKQLKLSFVPKNIKVVVYPNISSLRDKAPNKIKNIYEDKFYSYSDGETIHILSKMVYDPEMMGGDYEKYLKNELIINMCMQANPDLSEICVSAISLVLSGVYEAQKNTDCAMSTETINKFAKSIFLILKDNKIAVIHKYLKTADINVFTRYSTNNLIGNMKRLLFEDHISYFDRQNLLPSEFGIPDKRKYPIHDPEHVTAAIRMFNNSDPSEEKELAENIIKKINKYGMTDIKVGASNRFKPYYDAEIAKKKNKEANKEESISSKIATKAKEKINEIKDKASEKFKSILAREAAILQEGSFENGEYGDILKICNHLSSDEFKKISFHDTYQNSKFVIKRIIKKVGPDPVGFLDVYHFPSMPNIAQVVIAVSKEYRGRGIADEMVRELLNSDLHTANGFNIYYWAAHPENLASQNLAIKNGFHDTDYLDDYGRKVFIKDMSRPVNLSYTESSDIIPISEARDSNSLKLKQYLYQDRIKNNKETFLLYDSIKERNPTIKYTYIRLDMYKNRNIFVDLSYYHGLFLKRNTYRLDRGVNFYFDFINTLINNKSINEFYKKQTIFIPVDPKVWHIQPGTEIFDFKSNLNPISVIVRLVRSNFAKLRSEWGNKTIIFTGSRGYFKVDFNTFDSKNLPRFKNNIEKLMSSTAKIEDEYEYDDIDDESKSVSTSKALTATIIDDIEQGTSIKLDDMSSEKNPVSSPISHLTMNNGNIDIGREDNIAIIGIDPDGVEGYNRISKTILSDIKKVSTYCIPK